MAGKRAASSKLNQFNWNEDDEPDEAGVFQKATEDELKSRVIRVAKRRNPIGTLNTSGGEKNIFENFGGFKKSTTTTDSPFGFLAKTPTKVEETPKPKSNGISEASSIMFKMPENKTKSLTPPSQLSTTEKTDKDDEYYARLKGLNQSVSNWIKKHVDTNPLLNLIPVFKDYERYFEEIEMKYNKKPEGKEGKSTESKAFNSIIFTAAASTSSEETQPQPQFSFKATSQPSIFGNVSSVKDSKTTKSDNLQFAFKPTVASTPATFTFEKPASTNTGFTFGNPSTSNSFTFGNSTKTEETKTEEVDEDEPPKVEFTPVVEEGHVFSTRCKVFVKKDNQFTDRGVGQLYLKPITDSEKVQLIVRAETSLGNLLCNFILSKSIPTKRMGKKDVMLVCLPTPDSKPPPTPILLRVKSSEEADQLLNTLEKHKK